MKVINKSARLIFVGKYMLIPSRPCEIGKLGELEKQFPQLSDWIASGEIVKVNAKEASEAEEEFANAEVADLIKACEEKGIDTKGKKTKAALLKLLKA